jgi:predicted Zn-dependent protease with MMP-like domain
MQESGLSMEEFKELVRRVMQTLPPELNRYLDNLVVDVDTEPSRELLLRSGFTEEDIDEGDTLLGLFEPLDMPGGDLDFTDHPHKLWIFKYPHEEEFPDPKQLRIEIRKTVIHELAHHFGYTDRDLEAFDNDPNPFGDEVI